MRALGARQNDFYFMNTSTRNINLHNKGVQKRETFTRRPTRYLCVWERKETDRQREETERQRDTGRDKIEGKRKSVFTNVAYRISKLMECN